MCPYFIIYLLNSFFLFPQLVVQFCLLIIIEGILLFSTFSIIAGDGRMDSPGFNAQFCTYTFLENKSKDIVAMEVVDKREVQAVSVNMEKLGFIKGLEGLQDKGVAVTEVVTDAHSQITALLSKFS